MQPLDTVAEFQRRRQMATRLGAPFLGAAVVSAIALVVLFNVEMGSPELRLNLFFILGSIGIVSWATHMYIEIKYNRCPNCEQVPKNPNGSMQIDPVNCPKCGARLREYGSLFF